MSGPIMPSLKIGRHYSNTSLYRPIIWVDTIGPDINITCRVDNFIVNPRTDHFVRDW